MNMIQEKHITKHKKAAEAPSIMWFEMISRKDIKQNKSNMIGLINRINNTELVADWWFLQDGRVTWRQASSQSQAWGTMSKLQTGVSSICNTEEPVHSMVYRHYTHGYNIWKPQWEASTDVKSEKQMCTEHESV